MDLLGEDVTNIEEVEVVKKGILSILKAIQENKLGSGVSVKPTQLGLKLDKELAYQNIKTIIKEAAQSGIFVRIDMEDSSTTDATLSLYRRLKVEGLRNTGAVIQACLKRSESDIRALVKENADFRLCKGIYDESPSIAFKGRQEIRDNYLKLLRIILENGSQVGIATHDDFLIDGAQKLLQ
jgi:proline dehydrogenase